jgi:hypothetical protein
LSSLSTENDYTNRAFASNGEHMYFTGNNEQGEKNFSLFRFPKTFEK